MGHLTTHDYILLGIRLLPNSRLGYDDREELGRSLGFSSLTIRRTLTEMKKEDLIVKEKEGSKFFFLLTPDGIEKANEIYSDISNYYFTTTKHKVPSSIRLTEVIKLINDPFLKPFLVKLFFEKENFDLIETLKTFEMLKKETSIYNLFEKIDIFHGSSGMPNFTHRFMKATMFGMNDKDRGIEKGSVEGNIEILLLDADLKARRGDLEEALSLYRTILQKPNLPQELWFIGTIGLIHTYGKLGRREEWEKALKEARRLTDNKIVQGFLNQLEADLLSVQGDYEKAKVLFEKAIGTFRHYKYPVFLTITYNNYGILMFNRERYDEAQRLWKKGKRYALECTNRFLSVPIDINLASIIRIRGDLKKARKHLENAREVCKSYNYIEMLSSVEYNISLILISEGDFQKAIDLFNRSCFETYPLLSDAHREERLTIFKREIEKHKYTPLRRGPKYDLIYMG